MMVFSLSTPQFDLKILREAFHAGRGQNLTIDAKNDFGDVVATLTKIRHQSTDRYALIRAGGQQELKHIMHTFLVVCDWEQRDALIQFQGVTFSFFTTNRDAEIVLLTASLDTWFRVVTTETEPSIKDILVEIHSILERFGYGQLFHQYRRTPIGLERR